MIRCYKKYIVVCRPLTGGKILYKQDDDDDVLHKRFNRSDGTTYWDFWGEFNRFHKHYLRESLNSESLEYEPDMIIKSFDRLGEATSFMDNLVLDRSDYTKK